MSGRTYPTGWAALADQLARHGVDTVFGLPGDDMGPLTAVAPTGIRLVLCRDQRNAAFMATGYAVATGRPGVCVVGKGPAVTNTVTGLLEARAARVPLLLYAAGTAPDRVGTGAFQELDQVAAVRPVTKWATRVDDPRRLCAVLDRAWLIATAGSPGPVYVELPEPVATAPVTRQRPWRDGADHRTAPAGAALTNSCHLLRTARRPLLLVGGGARHRNQARRIERLAEVLGAGLATTASGRGTVDEDHELFCGLSGLYAPVPLAELWREADLVVALGSRLEETATFGWPDRPVPVLQVTLAEEDVATDRPGTAVLADVAGTVDAWLARIAAEPVTPDPTWAQRIRQARTRSVADAAQRAKRTGSAVPVATVLAALDRAVPPERILVQENGLQDMWSYFFPYWSCGGAGGSVVPSEQTSLGFGTAAAAGVACAAPGRPVVALVGDGAFNLFAPELATLADAGIAVLYVVLHNGGYGWLQANLDQTAAAGGPLRFLTPGRTGVAALARAHGLAYARVTATDAVEPALHQAWTACGGGRSAVVEIDVDVRDVPPGMESLAGDFPDPA